MSSINYPVALTNGTHINYLLSSMLKVFTIQTLFNIPSSSFYLEGISRNNYFQNNQGDFLNIEDKILFVQPNAGKIKLETIIVDTTDSRFLLSSGDYSPSDFLYTGFNGMFRRSLIKFDNLSSLSGKKIIKAYLRIFGRPHEAYTSELKEIFAHRIEKTYGNILKYTDMPCFNPQPEASIIVGETNEEVYSFDITSLVRDWAENISRNCGVLLKQIDQNGIKNGKIFYRTSKPPQLMVICLPN